MKTLFLLITLTQNGAGDINISFVNTETLQQCQQKSLMVEGVFKASDIPVIESRCIESDVSFTEFGHASTSSKIRNFYLIQRDEKSLQFSTMPDWQACMQQNRSVEQLSDAEQGKVYCGSSVQSIIER